MLPPPPAAVPDSVDEAGNPVYYPGQAGPSGEAQPAETVQAGARPVYVPAGLAHGHQRAGGAVPGLVMPPRPNGHVAGPVSAWGMRARAQMANPIVLGFLGGAAAIAAFAVVRAVARRVRRKST